MTINSSVVSSIIWKKLLERDDYQCLKCGSELGLQPAHYQARSVGGDENIDNLFLSCNECHRALHEGKLTVKRINGHFFFSNYKNARKVLEDFHETNY